MGNWWSFSIACSRWLAMPFWVESIHVGKHNSFYFMLAFSCLSPLLLVKSILLIGSFILFLRPHTCALIAQTYKVIKGLISSAETLRKHICFFAPFHLKGFFSRSLKFIAFYPLNLSFNPRHTLLNFLLLLFFVECLKIDRHRAMVQAN